MTIIDDCAALRPVELSGALGALCVEILFSGLFQADAGVAGCLKGHESEGISCAMP